MKKKERNRGRFIESIVTGVISGVVAALILSGFQACFDRRQLLEEERKLLNNVRIGTSINYLRASLGEPIVSYTEKNYGILVELYCIDNARVACFYEENQVVGYSIYITENNKVFLVPFDQHNVKNKYLLDFSYYERNETYSKSDIKAAMPASGPMGFYSELYYGAHPHSYNYYILGNWEERINSDAVSLMRVFLNNKDDEIEILRKKVKPNMYGEIKNGYQNILQLVPLGISEEQIITWLY